MKKVITHSPDGAINGWLMELQKDGRKTTAYITAVSPHGFKGLHLHKKRVANYVCIKGDAIVTTFTWKEEKWVETVTLLTPGSQLSIPVNTPTGLFNPSEKEEVLIVNFPDPAYDPLESDEQVEYTHSDIIDGVVHVVSVPCYTTDKYDK